MRYLRVVVNSENFSIEGIMDFASGTRESFVSELTGDRDTCVAGNGVHDRARDRSSAFGGWWMKLRRG